MDIVLSGKITFHDMIPMGTDGRAFNKLTQHIQYQDEMYLYEKWYNKKYVEEYLSNSSGKTIYSKIYVPKQ